LNTPATTPSGCIDGMVVSHLTGTGAAEMVRFWGEPPLVREPDVTLFGIERLDPPEQEFLAKSPMRYNYASDIRSKGVAKAAHEALVQVHADAHEFVLHLDVDVIASHDFPAVTEFPGSDVAGSAALSIDEVRSALGEFAKHKNLLGLDVAQYNPDKDPDGSGARKLVGLLVEVLAARLQAFETPPPPESPATPTEVSSSGTAA
jgi:arginase